MNLAFAASAFFFVSADTALPYGDTLTKPHAEGGLDLGRITSSLVIAAVMLVLIILTSRRAEQPPVASEVEG